MSASGSGGVPAPSSGGSKRLAQQQAQVDEVVDIMRQNVDKVLERDKNLSLLDDRADKLQHNAAQFEQHAGKLKRKFWLKNMKMMIILGIVGIILIAFVIAWFASNGKTEAAAVPPAASAVTTPIPMPDDQSVKQVGDEKTTRPRRRKKTTVPATATNSPVAADNGSENEPESSNKRDNAKVLVKRIERALIK